MFRHTPSRTRALFVVVVCAALGAGCGEPEGPGAVDPVPPGSVEGGEVEVGGGGLSGAFVPLDEGDYVAIIYGPQGGTHVLASVRLREFDTQTLGVVVALEDTFYGREVAYPVTLGAGEFLPDDGGWVVAADLVLFVDDGAWLHGREVVLRAEATDAYGRIAVDERLVVAW